VSAEAALERHYRRLLVCYPARHRAAYGEEMIGVLLACTPAGRRWPRLADAFDLVRGGLRSRIRLTRGSGLAPPWSDVLAVLTLVAPALLAIIAVPSLVERLAIELTARWFPPQMAVSTAAIVLGTALPPLLAWSGRRRVACATAAIAAAFFLSNGGYALIGRLGPDAEQLSFAMMLALEAVALATSPGPRRGRAILSAKQWAIVTAAVLVVTGFMLQRVLYVDAITRLPLLRLGLAGFVIPASLVIPAVVALATAGLSWR
jgi:hypothetical protein